MIHLLRACLVTAAAVATLGCNQDDPHGEPEPAVLGVATMEEEGDASANGTWWAKSAGGPAADLARSLARTADGGFAVAGNTDSFGAPANAWVVKLSAAGAVQWQKRYGDGYSCAAIIQTSDGGYALAGARPGTYDAWVAKLSPAGLIEWQKRYNFNAVTTEFTAIRQAPDGTFLVAGRLGRAFIAKLGATGDVLWKFEFGNSGDGATALERTTDGGCVVGGTRATSNIWVGWACRLDAAGQPVWFRRLGDTIIGGLNSQVVAYSVDALCCDATTLAVAGYGMSDNMNTKDLWVARLNLGDGAIAWQKKYGGTAEDLAGSIRFSPTGFVVAGSTRSFGAAGSDAWLVSLNATGGILWQRRYGGGGDDSWRAVDLASDGGFVTAGRTQSYGAGLQDFWIAKTTWSGGLAPLGVATAATTGVYGAGSTPMNALPQVPFVSFVNPAGALAVDTQAIILQQAPINPIPIQTEDQP